ncbi:hypothetical protein D3Z50_12800 [Clostridiaceae bacterium]|nr:hypothetical protein [Clostridiaceae bacterium]
MLKLCITFDYELFFGTMQASEEEILIQPAKRYLDMLNEKRVKGTFFADASALIRYRKEGMNHFPDLAERQLAGAYLDGHDVQLHIHPFWNCAVRDNDSAQWIFDNRLYRIHNHAASITDIVNENSRYLTEMMRRCAPDYKCIAFRAGGFCLQPEAELLRSLSAHGIVIDSSVCKGAKSDTGIHFYDYKDTPQETNWWMSAESGIKQSVSEEAGEIYEIPVGTLQNKIYKCCLMKYPRKLKLEPFKGKQTPVSLYDMGKCGVFLEKLKRLWSDPVLFTFDTLHYEVLEKMLVYYRKENQNTDAVISLIGHPKFGCSASVENLAAFIDIVKRQYGDVEFVTMKEIAKGFLQKIRAQKL